MPRIQPRLLRQAYQIDRFLLPLLPICRDLRSAQNELRWLREHADGVAAHADAKRRQRFLRQYVTRRARGEPLQYILGSEYFGDLEIKCAPGVLIPRPETALAVSTLASRLVVGMQRPGFSRSLGESGRLNVIDLCTGTGCIPLLFQFEILHALQRIHGLDKNYGWKLCAVGVDISMEAIRLARANVVSLTRHLLRLQQPVGHASVQTLLEVVHADVLHDQAQGDLAWPICSARPMREALRDSHFGRTNVKLGFDIMISNPPYISPEAFRTKTSRSVTKFEPRLALVPSDDGPGADVEQSDVFYRRLWQVAKREGAKVVLFEVGDMDQARRVADMAVRQGIWERVEIWRDNPNVGPAGQTEAVGGIRVTVRGEGNGRSVLAFRDEGVLWVDMD